MTHHLLQQGWMTLVLAALVSVEALVTHASVGVQVPFTLAASDAVIGTPGVSSSPVPGNDTLLAQLRAGDTFVVIRHAATDRSMSDTDPINVDDCSTQRNLSAQGRADSLVIGQAIRDLRIPIGEVLSSVYCRAIETGELAFGQAEPVAELDGRAVWPLGEETRKLAGSRLEGLIRERATVESEGNTVMIVHQLFPQEMDGTMLDEGEAAVYILQGDKVVRIGQLAPNEWIGLDPNAAPVTGTDDLSDTVERVLASVVSMEVDHGDYISRGSGFRVAVEGMVVTNAHIVQGTDAVSVQLPDGTRQTARVLGRAPDVDIAVLELDNDSGLSPLHSGSGLADLRVGDQVVAIGAPFGLPGIGTSGAITALHQPVQLHGGIVLEAVQIDASINAGNSGGPLVNARGEVIGVNTAIAMPSCKCGLIGIGFAIPVDVARSAALEIIRNG